MVQLSKNLHLIARMCLEKDMACATHCAHYREHGQQMHVVNIPLQGSQDLSAKAGVLQTISAI